MERKWQSEGYTPLKATEGGTHHGKKVNEQGHSPSRDHRRRDTSGHKRKRLSDDCRARVLSTFVDCLWMVRTGMHLYGGVCTSVHVQLQQTH